MSRNGGRKGENFESFYQSTPRVDADIGPLTLCPESGAGHRAVAMTLPANPTLLPSKGTNLRTNGELPQNLINEARVNLQSHVSDFFQQIAVAASPEDMMEADPVVPLTKSRIYSQNCDIRRAAKFSADFCRTPHLPKLAKITKLHSRCRTPYHTKAPGPNRSEFKVKELLSVEQTPLITRLTHLKLDQDLARIENVDNTVTEVLHKEQEGHATVAGKSVAEILASDALERCIGRTGRPNPVEEFEARQEGLSEKEERMENETVDEPGAPHNDSSVSSASQLLEDPSPMSWAVASPLGDLDGQFTLRRQRGIRRKRTGQQRDVAFFEVSRKRAKRRSASLSPKRSPAFRESSPDPGFICEAVNLEVNKFILETDLDASCETRTASLCPSLDDPKTEDRSRKTLCWELESPKSSVMNDDFHTSKSFLTSVSVTPEAPLVATVRRCLKYSPEGDAFRPFSYSSRGSIEVELSTQADHIQVRGKFT